MFRVVEKHNLQLADVFDLWLENQKCRCATSTYQSYVDVVKRVWGSLSSVPIEDISLFSIQIEINKLTYRGLSPATIKRYYYCLRASLELAKLYGYIVYNPAEEAKLPKKQQQSELCILQEYETEKLFAVLEDEPSIWKHFISLAYCSGLRRGELIALKVEDCDFRKNKIYVRRAGFYDKQKKCMVEKAPKSLRSYRSVYVDPNLMAAIRCYAAAKGPQDYLFSFNGNIMHGETVTHYFYRLCRKAGIARRGFHTLRHTHASFLLSCGCSLQAVSARLGHASLTTTQRYIHVYDEDDYRASLLFSRHKKKDVLQNVLSPDRSPDPSKHKVEATRFELTTSTSLM